MPSRLSSLLVRDGLIGVRRMEQAFQRQVIYGGCLDTILLEMNLVPEERLVQYLALSTGLPPATRAETDAVDPEAIEKCSIHLAREFRVVPLSIQDGALRVLVHDPVDLASLEEFADQLGFPVQPLVVPEYRYHVVFGRIYEQTPETRFAALAKRAEEAVGVSPVGRARTIIVDSAPSRVVSDISGSHLVVDMDGQPEAAAGGADADAAGAGVAASADDAVPSEWDGGESESAAPEAAAAADTEPESAAPEAAAAADTEPESAAPEAAAADTEPESAAPEAAADTEPESAAPEAAAAADTEPEAAPPETAAPASHEPTDGRVAEPHAAQASTSARQRAPGDIDPTPLSVADARVAFAAATDRDDVFAILLRAVRDKLSYAGLLTVQGGAAIGRIALVGNHTDHHDIPQVLIPLDEPSAFRGVVDSAAPHIGPIATQDPEINEMIERMGRVVPPAALLLPVVLRDRVVAIAVGHNAHDLLSIAEASELLPLASDAADALWRIIAASKARRKQVAARPGSEEGARTGKLEKLDPGELGRAPAVAPAEPSPAEPAPARARANTAGPGEVTYGTEVSLEAEEPRSLDEVIDALESGDDEAASDARAEALRRRAEALPVIERRFPGVLTVDRYALGGRVLPPAEHGPLLGLVVALDEEAIDLLVGKSRDDERNVRYYATLCLAELRSRTAMPALVERLFDSDYGTRTAAVAGLRSYPVRELDQGLVRVRQSLHSDDAERVQAAASALADLADVQAIPDMIEAQAAGGPAAEPIRRALVQLTKQSFGASTRKWRAWWSKSQDKSRIEWLLEGLSHKDEAIRRSSVEELRTLTGEHFEYHYDLPKREREAARKRWMAWWTDTGRKRFLRD